MSDVFLSLVGIYCAGVVMGFSVGSVRAFLKRIGEM